MDNLKKITKKIFYWEAKIILRRYKPKIIAVIGSVGKTLTKETLYLVMSKKFFVRKSEKSFTAELGVPLTVIGCAKTAGGYFQWVLSLLFGLRLIIWRARYPEWLILEVDGDKPGDLERVSRLIKPDILVITAIGHAPSHVELFADLENLMEEKRKIVDALKRDGVIIYNADDNQSAGLAEKSLNKKIPCGLGSDCKVTGSEYQILYGNGTKDPVGMAFNISADSKTYNINIFQTVGLNNEYACLLSFAVGYELQMSGPSITTLLNKYKNLPGRMNILAGIKNTIILDDSYNSSPVALDQALDVMLNIKAPRKVAVIGDMLELGKYSAEEHRKSAHKIQKFADHVICVGIRSRLIADELLTLGFSDSKIFQADSVEEAGKELQRTIEEGDLILIKGSQAMRMEKVVEEVMRHPQDKEKLLVRQERCWQER